MCRKSTTFRKSRAGQSALEYALVLTIFAAVMGKLWIFYEGFVGGNLYGRGDEALGLERVVSLPFP